MGTEISLSVDNVDICWSKNHMGTDHGSLFQDGDRRRMQSDQIDYDYFQSKNDPELVTMEMGFSKPLRNILPRLELMGFTLERVQNEYERSAADCDETRKHLEESNLGKAVPCMSFDSFLNIIKLTDISDLDGSYDKDNLEKNPSEYGKKFIDTEALEAVPHYENHNAMVYSEQSLLSYILNFLDPYSALRLLAENKKNLWQEVKWHYGPLVYAGWEDESRFQPNARRKQRFLIITEGHTDSEIIDLAIRTLRPEIHDFFSFIDMKEGHPFGGTGPLQKFAKGLAQMDVHNQTLFLYDNDTEGLSAFRNTQKLNLPNNMRVAMLPNLDEFKLFHTIGPTGEKKMDINGKAAAIECYLDLNRNGLPDEPIIQWSGYKADVKQYQGALLKKEKYTKDFLSQSPNVLNEGNYKLSKLKSVIDTIYNECVKIAEC